MSISISKGVRSVCYQENELLWTILTQTRSRHVAILQFIVTDKEKKKADSGCENCA